MSVHYLKKEVTRYICSLLRIIKLARQSFFNRNNIGTQTSELPDWAECLYHPGSLVHCQDMIGFGQFGLVFRAEVEKLCDSDGTRIVAAKTYSAGSQQGYEDLMQEGRLLSSLDYHFNVINLGARRKTSNQFKDVEGLTAGISISSQLQIMGTEQTMKMKMKQIQSHFHPPKQSGKSPDGPING